MELVIYISIFMLVAVIGIYLLVLYNVAKIREKTCSKRIDDDSKYRILFDRMDEMEKTFFEKDQQEECFIKDTEQR